MGFDRLQAEEQLPGDLGIGLALHDEPCNLQLAFGERLKAHGVTPARACAPVGAMSQPAELAVRFVAVAHGAACVKRGVAALKLQDGKAAWPA